MPATITTRSHFARRGQRNQHRKRKGQRNQHRNGTEASYQKSVNNLKIVIGRNCIRRSLNVQ